MKKFIGMVMVFMCLGFFAVPAAQAGIGLGASLGTGFIHKDGDTERVPTNVEVTPFIKIAIVSLDLGINFDLEELNTNAKSRHYTLRPGARVEIPLVYLRAAVPIQLNEGTQLDTLTKGRDYGFILGIGHNFSIAKVIGILIEVDANMSHEYDFTPKIEFRGGLQLSI
ncbi:MAG: hypothetical protein PHE84_12370 [bacterium]|nr:hypothetical protein [bacterium]